MEINKLNLKSNGRFSIRRGPYFKKQHSNQQGGLDLYVTIIDHCTGVPNIVKLYENKKGLYFKKNGNHYLDEFTIDVVYVPFQIHEVKE